MTQPPQPAAASADADTTQTASAEDELRRLQTACTTLSTQLHTLTRTRRQLTAQVSILATEAVEAGCRGELWITHEGKSNESRFHRVVRSSEITAGREGVRTEEVSAALQANGNGAGGTAAGTAGTGAAESSPPAEVRHKLCCVPGCTKKEQGKWYGKMW